MPTRQVVEPSQLVVGERRGDQQHRVGAHQPRVDHVELAHREVLADHGQAARVAGLLEVGDGPAEVGLVREHRQTRRTARFVRRGQHRRVEPDVQVTLRRRAPLDLGDHGEFGMAGQRGAESAGRSEARGDFDEIVDVTIVGGRPGPMVVENAIEVGGRHRFRPAASTRASAGQRPLPPAILLTWISGRPARNGPIDPPSAFIASLVLWLSRAA